MDRKLIVSAVLLAAWGCAEMQQLARLVQPPTFVEARDRRAEIRLLQPGAGMPAGGAGVRLWAEVTNPNSFGITLGTLSGTLFLESSRAATADFPLGLPLGARQQTVIPIDLSVSFSDLPGLGGTLRRAVANEPIAYRLDGTIGVEAGRFGTPTFGPMTLLTGELQPR
jgi:hypothetical protein